MSTRSGAPRGRRRGIGVLGSLVAVVFAMSWAPGQVSATMVERYRSITPYDEIRWDCGYPMHVVGTARDVVEVRAEKDAGGWPMVTDAYSFDETWTTEDGRSFNRSGVGVGNDTTAKRIVDELFLFTFKNPGLTTIKDSSGRVLFRDRGVLTYEVTIDLATGAFTFLGMRENGPHPIEHMDMCKAVAPITGTDSARYLTAHPLGTTDFRMGFYEYLPPSYDPAGSPSPLLIYLHGYGENGDGTPGALSMVLATAIPRFINVGGWPTDRPFVVLAPQHVQPAPDEGWCVSPDEIHDLIDYAIDNYNIDPSRVYVTGLSCGAIGTWDYLAEYLGEQVAAVVPISGDGGAAWTARGCELATVPIWAFHGEIDDVVPPAGSVDTLHSIQACPGAAEDTARLTTYPDFGHWGWDQTYSGEMGHDIYAWMLGFST